MISKQSNLFFFLTKSISIASKNKNTKAKLKEEKWKIIYKLQQIKLSSTGYRLCGGRPEPTAMDTDKTIFAVRLLINV